MDINMDLSKTIWLPFSIKAPFHAPILLSHLSSLGFNYEFLIDLRDKGMPK